MRDTGLLLTKVRDTRGARRNDKKKDEEANEGESRHGGSVERSESPERKQVVENVKEKRGESGQEKEEEAESVVLCVRTLSERVLLESLYIHANYPNPVSRRSYRRVFQGDKRVCVSDELEYSK